MFALFTPVLVGGAGLAVETSFDYVTHSRLQGAADASAYAAAIETMGGSDAATISTAASQQASANGWSSGQGTIAVHTPPLTGPNAGNANAVEVTLTLNAPRFFTAIFNSTPVTIRTRAVAITQNAGNACILALDKTAAQAVDFQGNTTVNLAGCDVMSNSVATNAINVWGSGQVSADCAMSSGGVANHGGLTITGCGSPITNAPRVKDPFANLPAPPTGPTRNISNGGGKGTTTLQPGNYKTGMDLSGNIQLAPGNYYVQGGDFKINANANITGSGVMIYLASGSHVSINGNASVNLSPQTSGTYSGVLFFGDRNGTGSNTFNGDATSHLTGDIYFPSQQVSYLGNFSGAGGCTQIVADTVSWSGNSTLGVNCASQGMQAIPARQAVKLVE